MKNAAVALQCNDAGAPEVVQHLYQIFFRVEVEECYPLRSQVHVERTYIQLLQLTRFSNTKVIQCKLEILDL